jgi:hypothetical protein
MVAIQAMASLQTVPVGQEALYNVFMDFAGQNITHW